MAKKNVTKIKPSILILILALSVSLLFGIFSLNLYLKTQQKIKLLESQNKATAQEIGAQEIRNILDKVTKHLVLPTGIPQIIRVANIETLKKTQPFFANAQNGNILLVFQNKVVIYDPVSDKIVDIAYIRPTVIPSEVPTAKPSSK